MSWKRSQDNFMVTIVYAFFSTGTFANFCVDERSLWLGMLLGSTNAKRSCAIQKGGKASFSWC